MLIRYRVQSNDYKDTQWHEKWHRNHKKELVRNYNIWNKEYTGRALWLSWLVYYCMDWKVAGLIPSQGTYPGTHLIPGQDTCKSQPTNVSFLHRCSSLSLSLSLSLPQRKKCPWEKSKTLDFQSRGWQRQTWLTSLDNHIKITTKI